ncbi:MAG: hypothetical protein QM766_01145 [Burkholderiaceae bacterium]
MNASIHGGRPIDAGFDLDSSEFTPAAGSRDRIEVHVIDDGAPRFGDARQPDCVGE